MLLPLRPTGLRRIPLVRYSARTKRENRIKVQLLKDFPQYGAKGEIIEVLPGLMRNKLYPNNGACYIIDRLNLGPRIPVVKKEIKTRIVEEVRREQAPQPVQIKTKRIQPLEIDSLVFGTSEATQTTETQSTYSLFNLEIKLDLLQLTKSSEDVTKIDITNYISQNISVDVPVEDLTILKGSESIDSIKEAGEYSIKVSKDGNTVTKKLIVS